MAGASGAGRGRDGSSPHRSDVAQRRARVGVGRHAARPKGPPLIPSASPLLAISTGDWILITMAVVLLTVVTVLWLWMAFDLVIRKDLGVGSKVLWFAAWILLAPVALVAYVLVGRRGHSTLAA
jgi:hypothetical protein